MKKVIKIQFILITLALISCVQQTIVKPENGEFNSPENVNFSVATFYPDQRLLYAEIVSTGLSQKKNEDRVSFAGIWSPHEEVSKASIQALNSAGFKGELLKSHIDTDTYENFLISHEQNINKTRHPVKPDPLLDIVSAEYLNKKLPDYFDQKVDDQLMAMARKTNATHLLEIVYLGDTYITFSMMPDFTRSYLYVRVIRISDNAIVFLKKLRNQFSIKDISNFSELEANDLFLIKKYHKRMMEEIFSSLGTDLKI